MKGAGVESAGVNGLDIIYAKISIKYDISDINSVNYSLRQQFLPFSFILHQFLQPFWMQKWVARHMPCGIHQYPIGLVSRKYRARLPLASLRK
jgi:hypothetical protein